MEASVELSCFQKCMLNFSHSLDCMGQKRFQVAFYKIPLSSVKCSGTSWFIKEIPECIILCHADFISSGTLRLFKKLDLIAVRNNGEL